MTLLHHPFEAACARLPDKVALVCGDERVTYRNLSERVGALAAHMSEHGIARGERVVLFLESGIEFAVAVHAVLKLGAVFVPVSPLTKVDKLSYILGDTRARALLTHSSLATVWRPALRRSPGVEHCVVHGEADPPAPAVPWPQTGSLRSLPPPIDVDLAALIFTSGTTGTPKGVMLSHHNMCSAWASVQSYLGLREDDVIGLALAPSFSYGLYNLLMGLGVGATVVLERSAAFPAKLAENLARERVTVFPAVPTMFSALLSLSVLASLDFSALRVVTSAAAPLPEEHVRRLRVIWPQATLFSMYGMTECMRVSYLPPEMLAVRPTSVGRGMANQDVWLADDRGCRLPNGSTGELVVRGAHVMRGYWDKPEETRARLRPGPLPGEMVLHTGDLFRTDADGWLYFVARKDDIIKSRGEKVAPREVEDAIYAMSGVLDCAVVGVPDEALGQAVKAFVTLKPGVNLTARDIIRHCLGRLESYMAPKFVEFVETLPRTDSGKIRKVELH